MTDGDPPPLPRARPDGAMMRRVDWAAWRSLGGRPRPWVHMFVAASIGLIAADRARASTALVMFIGLPALGLLLLVLVAATIALGAAAIFATRRRSSWSAGLIGLVLVPAAIVVALPGSPFDVQLTGAEGDTSLSEGIFFPLSVLSDTVGAVTAGGGALMLHPGPGRLIGTGAFVLALATATISLLHLILPG